MKEELLKIKEQAVTKIAQTEDLDTLENLRVEYMGKKGALTQILRGMGKLSAEERPVMGEFANDVKRIIAEALDKRNEELMSAKESEQIREETIDITEERPKRLEAHRHPLMQVMEELENLFVSMGFSIVEGPEIETVTNNFDMLKSPKNHPTRDLTDTFYIDQEHLLRTHTSPVQIRTMLTEKPPIRIISAGRTFRFDDVDDTHSPMFHQMEGLVVDKHVTMANLMHTLDTFIHEFFGSEMKTRYRPHYFPFTEPSCEVDVSCFHCHGAGCEVCHDTGWSMELLGCGMVHPNVLRNCGIDPTVYSGFAFGMGVDRIAMVKYGIDNIRLIFDNDARFLNQF